MDTVPVKVWDLPTRLFHWSLATLIALSWASGEFGHLRFHMLFGGLILVLVLFRLMWGLWGSQSARFTEFVKGPGAAFDYAGHLLEEKSDPVIGHNPLGGWMVVALLLLILVQGSLGLFADADDGIFYGPLSGLLSGSMVSTLTKLHKSLFNGLAVLVGLHIGAALFYLLVKRDNLVRPMVTGIKQVPARFAAQAPKMVSPLRALPAVVVAFAIVWAIFYMTPGASGW